MLSISSNWSNTSLGWIALAGTRSDGKPKPLRASSSSAFAFATNVSNTSLHWRLAGLLLRRDFCPHGFFPARRPASAAPPARRRPPERASHSGTRHARRALHTDRVPPPLWLVRSPLRSGSSCRSHAPTRQASSGLDPQPESRARLLVDARLRRISTQRARSLVPSVCSGNCSQAHSYSRGPRLSSPAESTTQASGGKTAARHT